MANNKKASQERPIICFRLEPKELAELQRHLKRRPVADIKSPSQLARKYVIDYLKSRLAYTNPADAVENHELAV
jgi:hypothetical protein